jgi:hypothetical protein
MADRPPTNRPKISLPNLGFAAALGAGIGTAAGVSNHDPATGIGVGVAAFLTIFVFDQVNRRKQR